MDDKMELFLKMKRINEWIAENPDVTEPNMYEMIDCVTQLGIIARQEGVVDMPGRFPEAGSDLAKLYAEWNKMCKARVSWDKVQSPEFSVNKHTKLYAYFTDLNMRCCTGEFRFPGMNVDEEELSFDERAKLEEQRQEFLECVRKIGSISLYINQQRLANPNFVYDNQWEYNELMSKMEKYKMYLPAYADKVVEDISGAMHIDAPSNPGEEDDIII